MNYGGCTIMKRYFSFIGLLMFFAVIIAGCATAPQPVKPAQEELDKLVWPAPPDEPRIKFVAVYRGSKDVEEENTLLRVIGEEGPTFLARPHGIVADRKGNIFVSDTQLLKVFKFDFEHKKFTTIGETAVKRATIPMGLAIDNDRGYLFVADLGSKSILVYDKENGSLKFGIGQTPGTFQRPAAVAVNTKTQTVYVCDTKLHSVKAFDYSGNLLFTIGKGDRSEEDDGFNVPSSVAVGKDGKLYVSDMFSRYIKVFSPEGKFLKKIGQGVGSGFGNFSKIIGVALDSEGHLYGLDIDFGNFQVFDEATNQLLTFAASSGRQLGNLLLPSTIFIDENDRIYVTDTFNKRIQVFQYLGSAKK